MDDQSWPIVDTSGETVVLVGLAPGPHKVLLELADATHKPIPGASKLVEFIVPAPKGPHVLLDQAVTVPSPATHAIKELYVLQDRRRCGP